MGIPGNEFDNAIHYSIDTQTMVTTAQKRRAWEQLQQQAARQVILAPYGVPPRTAKAPRTFNNMLLGWLRRGLNMLIMDETVYERASHRRDILHRTPYALATPTCAQQVLRFHMTDMLRYGVL
jgi:hypothetical protein